MTTNLNTAPYFDDFDENKNFHQVLFKPSVSVQSRELTQLQSILKNQIAQFGSHIFKHGSVVIPGNITSDLSICYVKLSTTSVNLALFEGRTVVGSVTGLRGRVRKYAIATATDPATLFVSYINNGINDERVFSDGETLSIEGYAGVQVVTAPTGACGGSAMAFINHGVFFINGTFVTVVAQSIVISKYSAAPNCHVLLKIDEKLITSDDDESLLDPAQGSYNYAAPGADRLQIVLTLTVLDLGASIDQNYVELMRFKDGDVEELMRYAKYSELEKNLARRTYDEAGDYISNGLKVSASEHLRDGFNGGLYPTPKGDSNKLVYSIAPGKAYINGFENELFGIKRLIVDKARGVSHVKSAYVTMTPSYGQYLYVSDFINLPDIRKQETLNLYNSVSGGALIGTAKSLTIDYAEPNSTESNAIFKLFLHSFNILDGYDLTDIGRIEYVGGSCHVLNQLQVQKNNDIPFAAGNTVSSSSRTAIVHKYTHSSGQMWLRKDSIADFPVAGDIITNSGGSSARVTNVNVLLRNINDNLLISVPSDTTYKIGNDLGVSDISYEVFYSTKVSCVNGSGSFSVSGLTINPKDQGNFIITSSTGVYPLSTATVSPDGLTVSFSGITPLNAVLSIICAATKTSASATPKSKNLVVSYIETGLVPSANVQLSQADGVRLISVISSTDGDVTSRFTFDNGQTDYAYLRSSLVLIGSIPTGSLTVTYSYFNHNLGSGDYFSIDSYANSGLTNYYESGYLTYKSKNSGISFNLKNVLDYRPRVNTSGSIDTLSTMIPQIESRISSTIQFYVGRIDYVVMDANGVVVVNGTPSIIPTHPTIPDSVLHLATIVVSPYTKNSNFVGVTNQNNISYTMKDIRALDKKVSLIAEYVVLSALESDTVNYEVVDAATGLTRYKNGYLVDTFNDPDKIADIYNPGFTVAYDTGTIIPQFEVLYGNLTITANQGQFTNSALTLPYTEVLLAKQPKSSRVTNINPFAVFSWKGKLSISPNTDNEISVAYLPDIVQNLLSNPEFITINRPMGWVAPAGVHVTFAPPELIVNTTSVTWTDWFALFHKGLKGVTPGGVFSDYQSTDQFSKTLTQSQDHTVNIGQNVYLFGTATTSDFRAALSALHPESN